MMRSGEKQKIIDQSLIKCHLNNETPKDRGEVKLYELSQELVLFLRRFFVFDIKTIPSLTHSALQLVLRRKILGPFS